ncbi:MAG TPA: hypothetical protein VKA34_20040 [Balneolales bacterium]|nr:hypothetical protein [Balneolales bacterium]
MPQNHTILLLIQVVVPLSLVLWFTVKKIESQLELILDIILTVSVIGFIIVAGRWDIFSIYFQYILILIYAIAFFHRIRIFNELDFFPDGTVLGWFITLFKIIIIGAFALLNYQLYEALQPDANGITINAPFDKGEFYVTDGGSNKLLNNNVKSKSQKNAINLVKLSLLGGHAKTLNPENLSDFEIYKDTVFSPVDGQIIKVVDNIPNRTSGNSLKSHPLGNYIVIQYTNCLLVLSNLQPHSSLVNKNMFITSGEPIAQVGASGDFHEPLLHIFAVKTTNIDSMKSQSGIPIFFNNTFPVKNTTLHF